MIIDCFQNQNLKNPQMSCLVTAVLEITECFYGILIQIHYIFMKTDTSLEEWEQQLKTSTSNPFLCAADFSYSKVAVRQPFR